MRNDYGFSSQFLDAARQAREAFGHLDLVREQMRQSDSSPARQMMELVRRDEAMRRLAFPHSELLGRFHELSESLQLQRRFEEERKLLMQPSLFERANEIARLAQGFQLPSALDAFRTPSDLLATKLGALPDFDWVRRADHLAAFNHASAISDLVGQSFRVNAELRAATQAFAASAIPAFDSLSGYRQFLDAAGMVLPRWPQVRLLTKAEKRRRFKAKLKDNVEPAHVKRAKSLVHRYELTLREVLDSVMADTYGEDWAEARLPLCGCNDLMGRWKHRGGDVLDHADYAHYERIMSHPDHFEAVFEAGFDDPAALAELMKQAGRLRAASHHPHKFTLEDLRDLRLTWRTIESGLLAFTPDFEVEAWS
jgi:hypothetical protein